MQREAVTHFEVAEERDHSSLIKMHSRKQGELINSTASCKWGYPIIDWLDLWNKKVGQQQKLSEKSNLALISAGLKIDELGIDFQFVDPLL